MADTVTSQTIQDGGKTAVLKFTNESDGSGESSVKKVDVSALAADSLQRMGYNRVYSMEGGFRSWKKAGGTISIA